MQGDYASLLSAFSELGLKLRLDIPEEAMEVTNFFFRRSVPAKESRVRCFPWMFYQSLQQARTVLCLCFLHRHILLPTGEMACSFTDSNRTLKVSISVVTS